jgi:hypothetical protein
LPDAAAVIFRERGFDLYERVVGRNGSGFAAPCARHARAEDQCNEFVGREMEGWDVFVAPQGIAHACLTLDGRAVALQVCDVAIEGAWRDEEPLGQLRSGHQATRTQQAYDAKEAVSAAHAAAILLPL